MAAHSSTPRAIEYILCQVYPDHRIFRYGRGPFGSVAVNTARLIAPHGLN